jgi:hypothetical protein
MTLAANQAGRLYGMLGDVLGEDEKAAVRPSAPPLTASTTA